MKLSHVSDTQLLSSTRNLVQQERDLLSSILHHLREIERRRLFSTLKYSSLFAYAVGELKYSEAQADRRISAMRLMRDLPEIEPKIQSGELSLTNLVLAQTYFSKERAMGQCLAPDRKLEVLAELENQPTRAAQKIIYSYRPDMKPKSIEFNYHSIEDEALRDKFLRLRGLLAHSHPQITLPQLLHLLCDQHLQAKSPLRPTHPVKLVANDTRNPTSSKVRAIKISTNNRPPLPSAPRVNPNTATRRLVWQKSGGRCENCGSDFALQIDHIHPRAMGGSSTPENLRLLCRSCNQRAAIESFGRQKMAKYLE